MKMLKLHRYWTRKAVIETGVAETTKGSPAVYIRVFYSETRTYPHVEVEALLTSDQARTLIVHLQEQIAEIEGTP